LVLPDTIDPQIPLSLLEAVREVDQPESGQETEYVAEFRNKRLGLSDTVYAQIRRYTEAVKRAQQIRRDEVAAIARLLGRRADAEDVFVEAGRQLSRASFSTLSAFARGFMVSMPGLFVRPMALRRLRRLANRHLGGDVHRAGGFVFLSVPQPVAAENEGNDVGAVFYEAALREYVALMVGATGPVEMTRSGLHGGNYEWRVEWRAASPAERRALRAVAYGQ